MVVMASAVPGRSLSQRMAALEDANRVRSYRAQMKREIAAGRRSFTTALDDPMCASMKVVDLLLAVPHMGRSKVHQALQTARISPSKTLAGMTSRQRDELLAALAGFPSVQRAMVAA
jgi:hypothetical protein